MSKVCKCHSPSATRVSRSFSQAEGVPLLKVHRSMDPEEKRELLSNLASHMLALFKHRFNSIGSLYSSHNPAIPPSVPQTPSVSMPGTPRLRSRSNLGTRPPINRLPSSPSFALPSPSFTAMCTPLTFTVGPIVSWPFFGEGRGLQHLDRGPWSSFDMYLAACCEREIDAVRKESEGRVTSHRPHRPPEAGTSAPSSDDEDDEDDGEVYYRDYRTLQRSSLLVSYAYQRVETCRSEMDRLKRYMRDLGVGALKRDELDAFSFDLHDLSLANIFVDEDDYSKIVSVLPDYILVLIIGRHASSTGNRPVFDPCGNAHTCRHSWLRTPMTTRRLYLGKRWRNSREMRQGSGCVVKRNEPNGGERTKCWNGMVGRRDWY